ncbi:MAG: hypothetical protein OEW58_10580 [Gammaproteobacteria bacterium]|nr:hypothetical protein [Gammaproteobacteria bacterium]
MKKIKYYFAFIMMLNLFACASIPKEKIDEIAFFESKESAPPYTELGVCECYGGWSILEVPTLETAKREAQLEAIDRGGNAVVLLSVMRVVDLPNEELDLTTAASRLFLSEKNASKVSKSMDENANENQMVWFFAIAKIERQ